MLLLSDIDDVIMKLSAYMSKLRRMCRLYGSLNLFNHLLPLKPVLMISQIITVDHITFSCLWDPYLMLLVEIVAVLMVQL